MTDIGNVDGTTSRSKRDMRVAVKVVSSLDDMQMVVATRACVFLGQPGWTYPHTFDPNDHCATHLLGFVDGEPAGTARIRWFAEFARIERIAIREQFRSLALLNKIADTALRLCRRKGYATIGGLTYPHLVPFWGRKGARPCGEPIPSDYGIVVPIIGTMEPDRYPEIQPLTATDAGHPQFEWAAYEWEGDAA